MGERKGTNKYYPPDFDPKKHKSLTGYTGSHPLRERARKLHLGILVIRFEMPYNIWCDGCKNHIGMGVRYNAEKSKVGMYYTTPIYKFRMKCHLCDNHFEIKTDPANHEYVIISGAQRKEQRWDPKENEQIIPEDKSTQKKLALDAMYKLEHGVDDKVKVKQAIPGLGQLEQRQALKKDDYLLNKLARDKFRKEKKAIKSLAETDHTLLAKSSLDIKLVDEHKDDIKLAGLLQYSTAHSFEEKQKLKRTEINSRPLFGLSPLGSTPESASSSSSTSSGKTPSFWENKQQLLEARKRQGLTIGKQSTQGFGSPVPSKSMTPNSLGIMPRSHGKNQHQEDNMKVNSTSQMASTVKSEEVCSQIAASEDSNSQSARQSTVKADADSRTALGSLCSYDNSSSSDETE